jgi:hypothetical protein
MNYENVKTFKELAETLKDHFSVNTDVEGEVNMSPNALNYDVTAARLAFVRLKAENRRDDLPKEIPTDLIDLLSLCEYAVQDKSESKKDTATKNIEHSFPLGVKSWARIFGISENKLRELRDGKTYHFRKVSPRLWTLPKSELPAEYLEKYRQATS